MELGTAVPRVCDTIHGEKRVGNLSGVGSGVLAVARQSYSRQSAGKC